MKKLLERVSNPIADFFFFVVGTIATAIVVSLLTGCDVSPLPVGMFGAQDGFVSFDSVCTGDDPDFGRTQWLTGDAAYMPSGGVLFADPRFSYEEIKLLQNAADAWCVATARRGCYAIVPRADASPDVQMHLSDGQGIVARCGAEAQLTDHGVPTWASTNRIAGNGIAIRLQLDIAPGDVRMMGVLHEMGHGFGLDHSADPAAVMFEGAPAPKSAPAPSDVAAFDTL